MSSSPQAKCQPLAALLEAFIAGPHRSRDNVRSIETEFTRHFDEDPRFGGLQYALAMYQGHVADVELLLAASRDALRHLQSQSQLNKTSNH